MWILIAWSYCFCAASNRPLVQDPNRLFGRETLCPLVSTSLGISRVFRPMPQDPSLAGCISVTFSIQSCRRQGACPHSCHRTQCHVWCVTGDFCRNVSHQYRGSDLQVTIPLPLSHEVRVNQDKAIYSTSPTSGRMDNIIALTNWSSSFGNFIFNFICTETP